MVSSRVYPFLDSTFKKKPDLDLIFKKKNYLETTLRKNPDPDSTFEKKGPDPTQS